MAKILIGNIKGPKGDTGEQGPQGATGPQGPQGPLPPLVNNALATEAGVAALDAVMGKTLQDQITGNDNDITQLKNDFQKSGQVASVEFYSDSESLASFKFILDSGEQYSLVALQNRLQLNRYNGSEWSAVWSLPTSG